MRTPNWFLKKNMMSKALLPLSAVYWLVGKTVFIIRHFGQKKPKTPVICVGGLLAGGTGKTPIVREIAKRLSGSVVVMRGYKGGDEAKMLLSSGIPVITGADRKKSIDAAEKAGRKHIIMDDGFQNPTVKKYKSILVFDGKIGVGNGFMLPAGPLREPVRAGIRRADAVIIIGDRNQGISEIAKRYKKPVFSAKNRAVNPGISSNVFAFAGIGYPQKFFTSVGGMAGMEIVGAESFPDHHMYSARDMEKIIRNAGDLGADYIVTTEKDWVRLSPEYQERIDFIPLETTIEDGFWKWLPLKKK
ncbi:MAG: tetraacyldisaccharide 4'-kinase [Alphaproteobacteria bacterium]|nr:tetraacyldisaccharide 4'-kinase [Alphaproteobacteria bacterium]